MKKVIALLLAATLCTLEAADTVVKLPEPNQKGGMPLMEALANRKSSRAFDSAPIPPNVLGELLWATWGYNRPGMRTAPTAINLQELDLYVLKSDGCWLYDAKNHSLVQTSPKDLRKATIGKNIPQGFALDAPVTLVFVSDQERATARKNRDFSEMDTGFLAQNAYLYCASAGLATVVRASFPPTLAKEMGLKETQVVTLCQCVGWPEKE